MSHKLTREDLSIGFAKEGYYIGWHGGADTASVFTLDGNHIADFERTESGDARLTETPGSPTDHGEVVIDMTEGAIADWVIANL